MAQKGPAQTQHTALVTGGSSGIGEASVRALLAAGFRVYAAARRVEKMAELAEAGARAIALDVTDEGSIRSALNLIEEEAGGVDVLVNNAGYGSYGAVEDVPMEEARRQFDVNLFGLARLTQLVIPGMRQKGWGRIINVSSMGGKIYTPFGAWYHATKHALEGWSDALRLELKPFGIEVSVIEPGGIATPWGTIAAKNLKKTSEGGAYAEKASGVADRMHALYTGGRLSSPDVVARVIAKAAQVRRPKTRYAMGFSARPALFMRRFLPDRVFDRIIGSAV